jgi:hypothetical protein
VESASKASGIRVLLSADGRKITLAPTDAASATYLRAEVLKTPLQAGAAIVTVEDYWPDFEMVGGRPATKSDQPNNPAALVRIQAASSSGGGSKPALLAAPGVDGIVYQLQRGGSTYASGAAKVGDTFFNGMGGLAG